MTRVVVKGGTVVSGTGQSRSDLMLDDGMVAAVGEIDAGAEVIDATGLLVLPGMVDTHVHLMDPGDTTREDFIHGTMAAAARGVTTIVEHTHSHPIRSVDDLRDKQSHLKERANVDYGLAAHVWPDRTADIGELAEAGITLFKIFSCTTHGVPGLDSASLTDALDHIAAVGSRCLIHNEDEVLTADAERRLKDAKRLDPGLLGEWRSREAELVAVASTAAMVLESGARATFAHVSTPRVLDVIDAFRGLGADIAAEACPQYFALDESELAREGALRKFTPPARIRDEDDRAAMWGAVGAGRFSHFSTDHAPSTLEQKTRVDFWTAPFGLPGLDTTLPFLIDAALTGRLPMTEVVRLYSTAPADRYGLAKGRLEPGSDADFVLVDPEATWAVSDTEILSKAGWSPYSGRTFKGRVVATYLGGEEIARDGHTHDLRTGSFVRPE